MIAAPSRRVPEGHTGRRDEQQLAEHETRHLGPLAAPVGEVMEIGWHGRELWLASTFPASRSKNMSTTTEESNKALVAHHTNETHEPKKSTSPPLALSM
jgi:hypothetical protein